jgi:hypothetical protein
MIAQYLGLTYDTDTDHYLISNDTHRRLLREQPTLLFQIAPLPEYDKSVDIKLPYSSLSLQLGFPYVGPGNMTWYFPIRRATNPNQFVLGRAFLQNAYLIADYERLSFSPHNVRSSESGSVSQIRKILPGGSTNTLDSWGLELGKSDPLSDSPRSGSLSLGAIAGIAVGITIFIAIIAITIFFLRRSRKRRARQSIKQEVASVRPEFPELASTSSQGIQEAHSSTGAVEVEAKLPTAEMPDRNGALATFFAGAELGPEAGRVAYEMEGSPAVDVKSETAPALRNGESAGSDVIEGGPAVPGSTSPAVSSPIPKTPLEFYGCLPS